MLNDSTRQNLVDKILNSKEFCYSPIYSHYLKYLVESSLKGRVLKETTIAIEVFGKEADFNPAEDTIVRSHTYSLRKKLERYYFTEGKNDKYRLKIPKGHYEAQFIQASDDFYSPKVLLYFFQNYYQLIIIVFLLIGSAALWLNNRSIQKQLNRITTLDKNDPIWGEYIQSKLPILIVPGDHFVYNMYFDKFDRIIGVRDVLINSNGDFDSLRAHYPDLKLTPPSEPYFPYHSVWSLPPLLSLFLSSNQKPILRKSSDLNPQILDMYNLIFVGSIKTLYTLKYAMARSHFDFSIAPHRITYTAPDTTAPPQVYTTNLHSSGPNEDLTIAVKVPGPVKNSIFIIASYHSLGAPQIVQYLISPEQRVDLEKIFYQKYNHIPRYFEILFRVIGIDKTAYNTQILVCNQLEEDK
jgi:hypothetical protein